MLFKFERLSQQLLQKHKEKYFLLTSSNMGQLLIGVGKPDINELLSSAADRNIFLKRVYRFLLLLCAVCSPSLLWIFFSNLIRSTQSWHGIPSITQRLLGISFFSSILPRFFLRISSHRIHISVTQVYISMILLHFFICKKSPFLLYFGIQILTIHHKYCCNFYKNPFSTQHSDMIFPSYDVILQLWSA